MDKTIEAIGKAIDRNPMDVQAYEDMISAYVNHVKAGEAEYHAENRKLRNRIVDMMDAARAEKKFGLVGKFGEQYRRSLLLGAPVCFDDYLIYVESNRDPKKQFYLPRRDKLIKVVNLLQGLADDKYDIVCISQPPGTGKSGTAIFFLSWIAGKYPDEPSLTGSHSNAFVRGVYDECLRIFDPNGEYLWKDVFPGLSVTSTNAKDLRIDLGKRKRFETLEFTSVGAGNAGLYRATRLLFCDDLVPGIEAALSKERMDKLWETYTTDLRQRKLGDHCKELHLATRWSVHDVIGRLSNQYEQNDRAQFLVMPALNEKDESNFDYKYGVGFSTEFYHEQRDIMDDASWRALYMNEPIEREGQLYSEDELRRFFEPPEKEPDAIIAICDTKNKGTDYAFCPIARIHGYDWYIVDCICDNGDPGIVEERLTELLVKNHVQIAEFESNSAGWHIAWKIQENAKKRGSNVKITQRYTTANKETKIIVNAPAVKDHCLFLDNSKIKPNSDYGRMMKFLTGYTMTGKNKHDDVPDGMAMLALYMENMSYGNVQIIRRPW